MTLQPDLFRKDFINKLRTQTLTLKFDRIDYDDLRENSLYIGLYLDLPTKAVHYDIVTVKLTFDFYGDYVTQARFYAGDDSEVCEPDAIALLLSEKDAKRHSNILRGTPL